MQYVSNVFSSQMDEENTIHCQFITFSTQPTITAECYASAHASIGATSSGVLNFERVLLIPLHNELAVHVLSRNTDTLRKPPICCTN